MRRTGLVMGRVDLGVLMVLIICLSLLLSVVHGSIGDRDPLFHQCLDGCACPQTPTTTDHTASNQPITSPINAYWFYPEWDCQDECVYTCVREVSAVRVRQGHPVFKYYGHWPFVRYGGFDQAASVAFSLLNCVPNTFFLVRHVARMLSGGGQKLSLLEVFLTIQSASAILAWVISAIFHSRLTDYTTALDYCSALTFLTMALWVAFYRVIGQNFSTVTVWSLFALFVSALAYRLHILATRPIDFGMHMNICVAISTVQAIIWIYWAVFGTSIHGKTQKYICLACQVWLTAAASLELLDFPPFFGLFDAHSLWHLVTIPLGFLWNHFWEAELRSTTVCTSATKEE
jgi:hypothetical protein